MRLSRGWFGYIFLAPIILALLGIGIYPLLYQVWLSFTDWYLLRNPEPVFHGLKGYERLLSDRMVWQSLWRTIIWTVGTVTLEYILGMLLAVLLNRPTAINRFLSALILLPWVVPSIVVAYTWRWLLDGEFGFLHYILQNIGLAGERSLLGDPASALWALIVVSAWKGTPFMVVALLAALKGISQELYEAAAVDGATSWQRFRHITMPLTRRVGVVMSLVLGILAFYSFDLVWIITKGGPSNATSLIGVYLFRNFFERQELSYAATISLSMLVILFGVSFIYLRLFNREEG